MSELLIVTLEYTIMSQRPFENSSVLFDGVGVLEQQSLSVLTEEMSAQNISVLSCQCCCTEKINAFHP
jgi:hypothetical protein